MFKPFFWGGPQESHLTPLATRTTNEELSAESFMTRMRNEVYQASSFKIYVFKSFGFNITHLETSLEFMLCFARFPL